MKTRDRVDEPAAATASGVAVLALAGTAALVQAGLAFVALASRPRPSSRPSSRPGVAPAIDTRSGIEARGLHGAAALLATSVLADSAVEHYRGSFENPAMYTPLITSALAVCAGVLGAAAVRERAPLARRGAYASATLVGIAGTGFHLYNVGKRPGGVSWLNVFYAAPFGAPAALSLAGLLGLAAGHLQDRGVAAERPRLLGVPAGRALAALTSVGLAGTAAEAGLLHFRGAFQNPFMWLPVSLPPVAAALMARAALSSAAPTAPSQRAAAQAPASRQSVSDARVLPAPVGHRLRSAMPAPAQRHRLTRAWLKLTAVLGLAGTGFHAFGVSRAMGGWRNWSQNVVDGPPLPAPPSFSALALAALAALSLIERDAAGAGVASAARHIPDIRKADPMHHADTAVTRPERRSRWLRILHRAVAPDGHRGRALDAMSRRGRR